MFIFGIHSIQDIHSNTRYIFNCRHFFSIIKNINFGWIKKKIMGVRKVSELPDSTKENIMQIISPLFIFSALYIIPLPGF